MSPESKERILTATVKIASLLDRYSLTNSRNSNSIRAYPSHGSVEQSSILELIIRSIDNMTDALGREDYTLLPEKIPYVLEEQDQVVILYVARDFDSILIFLEKGDFGKLKQHLDYVVYYLISIGIWFNFPTKEAKMQIDDNYKLKSYFESSIDKINTQLKEQEETTKLLNENRKLIDDFVNISRKNLEVISGEIDKASKVDGILENISASQANINFAKNQITTLLAKASEEIDLNNKNFENLSRKINDGINQANKFELEIINYEDKVKSFLGNYEVEFNEIVSKKEYIARLERLAADDTLGTRFDKRKRDIRVAVWIWFAVSIIVFGATLYWSNLVFTSTITDKIIAGGISLITYFDYFIVFIRTAPAYIILYFCFSRYIKERNFQEEYAFKSVISMTLTAYSDMLANTDEEKQKAKIEMLQKSIASIYTQPRVHTESNRPFFSFNSKDVSESLKQLVEAIKAVKP